MIVVGHSTAEVARFFEIVAGPTRGLYPIDLGARALTVVAIPIVRGLDRMYTTRTLAAADRRHRLLRRVLRPRYDRVPA